MILSRACFAIVLLAGAATAQDDDSGPGRELGVALWVAHAGSTNLALAAAEERGSYQSLGASLDLSGRGTRIAAGVLADVEYRKYSLEEPADFSDERVGTLRAFAELDIVRERFAWLFNESYGQGQSDPFRPVGPGNREEINVMSTGPRVSLPLGRRTALSLDGTFEERQFESRSLFDSTSTVWQLGVFRSISRTGRVGIVADREDVDYDGAAQDFAIEGAGLRYERDLATGGAFVELGSNRVMFADFDSTGPRVRLGWSRALSARSRLIASANREFTDAAALFELTVGEPAVLEPTDVLLTTNPLNQERLELEYVLEASRTEISFGVASMEERYEVDSTSDNRSERVAFAISRAMSTRTRVGLVAERLERDYIMFPRTDRDTYLTLWLDRRLRERLSLQAQALEYERGGETSLSERRYEIRLRYEPIR